jgi:hypothetical protein
MRKSHSRIAESNSPTWNARFRDFNLQGTTWRERNAPKSTRSRRQSRPDRRCMEKKLPREDLFRSHARTISRNLQSLPRSEGGARATCLAEENLAHAAPKGRSGRRSCPSARRPRGSRRPGGRGEQPHVQRHGVRTQVPPTQARTQEKGQGVPSHCQRNRSRSEPAQTKDSGFLIARAKLHEEEVVQFRSSGTPAPPPACRRPPRYGTVSVSAVFTYSPYIDSVRVPC